MDQTPWKAGLEDVIAARSAVCAIDGAAGRLFYRGYEIAELAGAVPFEEVAALLWRGERPDAVQAADFRTRLKAARGLPGPIEALLRALPRDCHPLDALRTAISLDAALDPDVADGGAAANLRKSFRLMVRVPEVVGAWHRIRTGRDPVAPRRGGSHAAYVLWLLEGREPSDGVARVIAVALTVHAAPAVVYDALGIPADLCTSIFAIGRVAGWCAHAMEQYADNRLIRPRADYIGVAPRRLAAAAARQG